MSLHAQGMLPGAFRQAAIATQQSSRVAQQVFRATQQSSRVAQQVFRATQGRFNTKLFGSENIHNTQQVSLANKTSLSNINLNSKFPNWSEQNNLNNYQNLKAYILKNCSFLSQEEQLLQLQSLTFVHPDLKCTFGDIYLEMLRDPRNSSFPELLESKIRASIHQFERLYARQKLENESIEERQLGSVAEDMRYQVEDNQNGSDGKNIEEIEISVVQVADKEIIESPNHVYRGGGFGLWDRIVEKFENWSYKRALQRQNIKKDDLKVLIKGKEFSFIFIYYINNNELQIYHVEYV